MIHPKTGARYRMILKLEEHDIDDDSETGLQGNYRLSEITDSISGEKHIVKIKTDRNGLLPMPGIRYDEQSKMYYNKTTNERVIHPHHQYMRQSLFQLPEMEITEFDMDYWQPPGRKKLHHLYADPDVNHLNREHHLNDHVYHGIEQQPITHYDARDSQLDYNNSLDSNNSNTTYQYNPNNSNSSNATTTRTPIPASYYKSPKHYQIPPGYDSLYHITRDTDLSDRHPNTGITELIDDYGNRVEEESEIRNRYMENNPGKHIERPIYDDPDGPKTIKRQLEHFSKVGLNNVPNEWEKDDYDTSDAEDEVDDDPRMLSYETKQLKKIYGVEDKDKVKKKSTTKSLKGKNNTSKEDNMESDVEQPSSFLQSEGSKSNVNESDSSQSEPNATSKYNPAKDPSHPHYDPAQDPNNPHLYDPSKDPDHPHYDPFIISANYHDPRQSRSVIYRQVPDNHGLRQYSPGGLGQNALMLNKVDNHDYYSPEKIELRRRWAALRNRADYRDMRLKQGKTAERMSDLVKEYVRLKNWNNPEYVEEEDEEGVQDDSNGDSDSEQESEQEIQFNDWMSHKFDENATDTMEFFDSNISQSNATVTSENFTSSSLNDTEFDESIDSETRAEIEKNRKAYRKAEQLDAENGKIRHNLKGAPPASATDSETKSQTSQSESSDKDASDTQESKSDSDSKDSKPIKAKAKPSLSKEGNIDIFSKDMSLQERRDLRLRIRQEEENSKNKGKLDLNDPEGFYQRKGRKGKDVKDSYRQIPAVLPLPKTHVDKNARDVRKVKKKKSKRTTSSKSKKSKTKSKAQDDDDNETEAEDSKEPDDSPHFHDIPTDSNTDSDSESSKLAKYRPHYDSTKHPPPHSYAHIGERYGFPMILRRLKSFASDGIAEWTFWEEPTDDTRSQHVEYFPEDRVHKYHFRNERIFKDTVEEEYAKLLERLLIEMDDNDDQKITLEEFRRDKTRMRKLPKRVAWDHVDHHDKVSMKIRKEEKHQIYYEVDKDATHVLLHEDALERDHAVLRRFFLHCIRTTFEEKIGENLEKSTSSTSSSKSNSKKSKSKSSKSTSSPSRPRTWVTFHEIEDTMNLHYLKERDFLDARREAFDHQHNWLSWEDLHALMDNPAKGIREFPKEDPLLDDLSHKAVDAFGNMDLGINDKGLLSDMHNDGRWDL